MSEIHFCDLCNESVPDGDLQIGRAFLVKGRVVCANCNRAMSSAPDEAQASGVPSLEPVEPELESAALQPAAGAARAPARSSPASHGAALALGGLALVLTVVLGYWLTDQVRQQDKRAADRASAADEAQRATVA